MCRNCSEELFDEVEVIECCCLLLNQGGGYGRGWGGGGGRRRRDRGRRGYDYEYDENFSRRPDFYGSWGGYNDTLYDPAMVNEYGRGHRYEHGYSNRDGYSVTRRDPQYGELHVGMDIREPSIGDAPFLDDRYRRSHGLPLNHDHLYAAPVEAVAVDATFPPMTDAVLLPEQVGSFEF